MKILVTGGEGFVGKPLLERLKKQGHEVESFDLINGQDLLNREQVMKAVEGKDVVFHLAAMADLNVSREKPLLNTEVNVIGTINIAEACWRAKTKLYYISTCCVYGNQEKHPTDEKSSLNPTEIYACSKLAGEYVVLGYAKTCGLEYNILRLATIYGPGMRPALVIHVFLDQAMNNNPITIHGDGKQTRTFTYIDDIIDGIMACFDNNVEGEIFNITHEKDYSVLDIAELAKKVVGNEPEITFVGQRPGQVFLEKISAQEAKDMLGWEAKVDIEEGIKRTYEWLKTKA